MIPRWSILPAAIALVSSSMVFAAAGAASASVATNPGTTSVRPGGAANTFVPGGLMKRPTGALAEHDGKTNATDSTNWSGYAASGSDGSFTSVSSSWTEPSADCSDGGDDYAAFWVGLDGYSSDSVEQTGTDSDCSGGSPDYYGWYEMYPADPVYFTNTVEPGDSMSASVTVSGTTYKLVLTDSTEGWTKTVKKKESGLDDSSAEVITEAPSSSSGVLPLADFGTVNYTDSTANGESLSDSDPTDLIMVSSSGDQLDTTSSIGSSGDFSNTWEALS